jgi:membrane dipeptidase
MKRLSIFDGHNDTLLRLTVNPLEGDNFFASGHGHIDLARARQGGMDGGFFAIFLPNPPDDGGLSSPHPQLPAPLGLHYAQSLTLKMMATLFQLERESQGQLRVARSVADIIAAREAGAMSAVLHLEGAEAIDEDLCALEVFYQAGLRSLGPVWSRPTIFAEGVPFLHRHSPDTGAGLTEAGMRLVQACNARRIMIDLSHINEAGFWDVAKWSTAPLVATHSNAWALSPSTRNLTDKQLDAIRDSDGMVGLNFAVLFLREDGASDEDTAIDVMVDHIDYLVSRVGIERVGFGSDFDGAPVPRAIGDVSGLPRLVDALRARGYGADGLQKLCFDNWMRVLKLTWGE